MLDLELLDTAISRGAADLKARQGPDGSWEGETDLGPVGVAMHCIVLKALGAPLDEPAATLRYLLSQQLSDGAYLPFPFAEAGSAAATALCRAALLACGIEEGHPALAGASRFVEAHGGHDAIAALFRTRGELIPLFLLTAGVLDGSFLPAMPSEVAFAPVERLLGRRIHAGNFMGLLVLCALVQRYREPPARWAFGRAAKSAERLRIQRYLFEWQNPTGDWNGQANQTWLMLLGLAATGLDHKDPRIARALTWLRALRGTRPASTGMNVMRTDVWGTATVMLALDAAGGPAHEAAELLACRYLLGSQCRAPMPRANQRKSDAQRTGGWPFQRGNETMPDTDDTGVVLAALGALSKKHGTRELFAATEVGMRWVRDMQNPNGSFPSYVWGLKQKRPGPMFLTDLAFPFDDPRQMLAFFLDPPAEFSDPGLEDVTGRVLWGLGLCGVGRDDPAVCRAIAFLREQQCANGGWWGRWMPCYLIATSCVLVGLAAIGEDLASDHVRNAVRFLRACQNDDGGFGEGPGAYRDPALAGRGPSAPIVTGHVLHALLATERCVDPALERAAQYLLSAQEPSGTWSNGAWLHTLIPPDAFYVYDLPSRAIPLLALARFRSHFGPRA